MKKYTVQILTLFLLALFCLTSIYQVAKAADDTIAIGQGELQVTFDCNTVDSKGCYLKSNGFVAQATGYKGTLISRSRTTKITLKNLKDYPVIVEFTAIFTPGGDTNVATFSHNGQTTISIGAGSTATISIKGYGANNTSTLDFTISDILNNASYQVNLGSSNNCSYTASNNNTGSGLDAVSVTAGMSIKVNSVEDGLTCIGFADGNGNIVTGVDTEGNATFKPTSNCTIYPILVENSTLPSAAPFQIGTTRFFYTWESAFAACGKAEEVALAVTPYTLPTELTTYIEPSNVIRAYTVATENGIDYIVPAGKTFLGNL